MIENKQIRSTETMKKLLIIAVLALLTGCASTSLSPVGPDGQAGAYVQWTLSNSTATTLTPEEQAIALEMDIEQTQEWYSEAILAGDQVQQGVWADRLKALKIKQRAIGRQPFVVGEDQPEVAQPAWWNINAHLTNAYRSRPRTTIAGYLVVAERLSNRFLGYGIDDAWDDLRGDSGGGNKSTTDQQAEALKVLAERNKDTIRASDGGKITIKDLEQGRASSIEANGKGSEVIIDKQRDSRGDVVSFLPPATETTTIETAGEQL